MADDDDPTLTDPAGVIDAVAAGAALHQGEDQAAGDADDEVAAWQERLATAAISPRAKEALTESREHLDAAWHSSDAGTEAAPAGRLRHARRAALVGMRPLTSHQIPFNRELVVAVDRLTRVVEELATRLELVDTLEERYGRVLRRAQAGVATTGVQIDDLAGELAEAEAALGDVTARLATLEAAVADQRQLLGATRAREDLVLRTLRDGRGEAPSAPALAAEADAALLRRLAAAVRPRPEIVVGWARDLEPTVAAAAAGAPVLDLDPDRGEWLDVWAGLPDGARGVESDPTTAAALRERGHDVADGDPGTYLAGLPAGSLGAVTAVALADIRPLPELVEVVDGAGAALRPGGVLVLVLADPTTLADGDVLWADPRRRPVFQEVVQHLVLERGFVEAEVVSLARHDEAPQALALIARTAGGAPPPA